MNNDLISREALKEILTIQKTDFLSKSDNTSIENDKLAYRLVATGIEHALNCVNITPPVESERPQGEWQIIHHKDLLGRWNSWDEYKCSACKHSVSQIYEDAHGEYATKFCPNCGAKMQNGDSE